MRALVFLVVAALATPAAARPKKKLLDHHWGVVSTVGLMDRRRRGSQMTVTIAPTTKMRDLPPLSADERRAKQALADRSQGNERIAALESLLGALENDFDRSDDGEQILHDLGMLASVIIAEPTLDAYPDAPELITRVVPWVVMKERVPEQLRLHLIATFPNSPFVMDARIGLAATAEADRRWAEAKKHLVVVMASKRPEFVTYARFKLAWVTHLAGGSSLALGELAAIAKEQPNLRPAIAELAVHPYAQAGRARLARAYFEALEAGVVAEHLRALGGLYIENNRNADAVLVFTEALGLDNDLTETCRDRADIVHALANAPNRTETELAVAELERAAALAGQTCASDVEAAITDVAVAWNRTVRKSGDRERASRMWARVLAIATSPQSKSNAILNRLVLRWELARSDRRVATWIEVAELCDEAIANRIGVGDAARDAWTNARMLGPTDEQAVKIDLALAKYKR